MTVRTTDQPGIVKAVLLTALLAVTILSTLFVFGRLLLRIGRIEKVFEGRVEPSQLS